MSVALTEICRYQVDTHVLVPQTKTIKILNGDRATALVEEIEDACFYRIGHEKLDKFRLYCRYCISPSSSCLFSSGVTHANLTMRDCKMLDLRNNKSITVEWKRKIHFMTSEVSLATW